MLGGEAKPPRIEVVTFNRKYWYFIHGTDVAYRWEHSGGHNVLIAPYDLEAVLSRLSDSTIDEIEAARGAPKSRSALLPSIGITSEYELELAFLAHIARSPSKRRLGDPEVRRRCDGLIPDVLLDVDEGPTIVVELKFSRASRAELDQLERYLQLPSLVRRCGTRRLAGALVARSFGEDIISLASEPYAKVSLYQFGFSGDLDLHLVAGDAILEQSGLA